MIEFIVKILFLVTLAFLDVQTAPLVRENGHSKPHNSKLLMAENVSHGKGFEAKQNQLLKEMMAMIDLMDKTTLKVGEHAQSGNDLLDPKIERFGQKPSHFPSELSHANAQGKSKAWNERHLKNQYQSRIGNLFQRTLLPSDHSHELNHLLSSLVKTFLKENPLENQNKIIRLFEKLSLGDEKVLETKAEYGLEKLAQGIMRPNIFEMSIQQPHEQVKFSIKSQPVQNMKAETPEKETLLKALSSLIAEVSKMESSVKSSLHSISENSDELDENDLSSKTVRKRYPVKDSEPLILTIRNSKASDKPVFESVLSPVQVSGLIKPILESVQAPILMDRINVPLSKNDRLKDENDKKHYLKYKTL